MPPSRSFRASTPILNGTLPESVDPSRASARLAEGHGFAAQGRLEARAKLGDDLQKRLIQRDLGSPAEQVPDLPRIGNAPPHVLEIGRVRLCVGYEFEGRPASGKLQDSMRQIENGDLVVAADVEDLPVGAGAEREIDQGAHDVLHMAEASGLEPVVVVGK